MSARDFDSVAIHQATGHRARIPAAAGDVLVFYRLQDRGSASVHVVADRVGSRIVNK
jgi:hypothetical protein